MTLHEYRDVEPRSDEWFTLRRGILTASVVGQLVTPTLKVASNDTSRALTALLVSERITGYTEPTFINSDMLRGLEDEPRALEHYSEHYAQVAPSGFMVEDKWGFQIGFSPDGLVGEDGLVEVKSRRAKKQIQTFLADEVPPENMAQLQCGLFVSGRLWIDYCSYAGGLPMYVKRVYPDSAWFDAILDAAEQFERTAAEMATAYGVAVDGLPLTERVDLELVI